MTRPPWDYLARAEREIRRLFAEIRTEVVIAFGPEGAYGHPDHRQAGDAVSQVVQSGTEGAPRQLLVWLSQRTGFLHGAAKSPFPALTPHI